MSKPKMLLFDIETAPIIAHVWQLWDNNVALNQIVSDWHVLSWSAKWYQDTEGNLYGPHKDIMYMDQRNAKNISDDKTLLKGIWKLLDEADIVITQNGKKFDEKKLNARFVINGMDPPSSYKHIDTRQLAAKRFGFTSNKLEYLTDKLCTKYKKLKHNKFPGHELWTQCLSGNKEAWNEMEKYNTHDVLGLEELYTKLAPWDNSINFSLYNDTNTCSCGSTEFLKNGYCYTSTGRYQRYCCKRCKREMKGAKNLAESGLKRAVK